MTQNIIWPTIPIHSGLSSRGFIRKKVRKLRQQHHSLEQEPQHNTLIIGNASIPQKNSLRIRKNISPTRTHTRDLKTNEDQLSKTFLMANRKQLVFSQNTSRTFEVRPKMENNQKDIDKLELNGLRWTSLRKKSYRIRRSNLSNYESDQLEANSNESFEAFPQKIKKIVGHHIDSCSPMNRKVASRLN